METDREVHDMVTEVRDSGQRGIPAPVTSLDRDTTKAVPLLTGHFGTRTFRHQDSSAPVQNGAEVSRDNSAPDYYWCRTVRTLRHQCRGIAEIPRDTSAPSVKNAYDMGLVQGLGRFSCA